MASATEVQKSAFRLRFTALHKYQNRCTLPIRHSQIWKLYQELVHLKKN